MSVIDIARSFIEYANIDDAFNPTVDADFIAENYDIDQIHAEILSNPVINSLYEKIKNRSVYERFLSTADLSYLEEMYINTTFIQEVYMRKCRANPMSAVRLSGDKIVTTEPKPDTVDNLFEYAKSYLLPIFRFTGWDVYPDSYIRYILNILGLPYVEIFINILEATLTDFFSQNYANAQVGLLLALSLPFIVLTTKKEGIPQSTMSSAWVDLYISWNANFVIYGTNRHNLPVIWSKLIANQTEVNHYGYGNWLWNRTHTLMMFIGQIWRKDKVNDVVDRDMSSWFNQDLELIQFIWQNHNLSWAKEHIDDVTSHLPYLQQQFVKLIALL